MEFATTHVLLEKASAANVLLDEALTKAKASANVLLDEASATHVASLTPWMGGFGTDGGEKKMCRLAFTPKISMAGTFDAVSNTLGF